MRKANERNLDSKMYARLKDVQMSAADREDAVAALIQAERIADTFLWVKEKFADAGQAFLKPSLKH